MIRYRVQSTSIKQPFSLILWTNSYYITILTKYTARDGELNVEKEGEGAGHREDSQLRVFLVASFVATALRRVGQRRQQQILNEQALVCTLVF